MDTPLNLSGQMLIAMPSLNDPRFEHAVVFLCDHSEQGAMGLIVNKAVPGMSLANLLEEMDISSSEGINQTEIYFGGPVEGGRGFVLHNPGFEGTGTVMVNDHFSLTATRDILEAMATGNGPEQVLVALGYAGSGAALRRGRHGLNRRNARKRRIRQRIVQFTQGFPQNRMAPIRRDVQRGNQHESAVLQAWMGQ